MKGERKVWKRICAGMLSLALCAGSLTAAEPARAETAADGLPELVVLDEATYVEEPRSEEAEAALAKWEPLSQDAPWLAGEGSLSEDAAAFEEAEEAISGGAAFAGEEEASEEAFAGEETLAGEGAVTEYVEEPFAFTSEEAMAKVLAESKQYPAAFDLRSVDTDGDGEGDRCYVTSVKSQSPFDNSWSFAAIAAAETSILGSVLADDPEAYKTLDLSEKQLAYFTYVPIADASHSQCGEGIQTIQTTTTGLFDDGWDEAFVASNVFAMGVGPSMESREGFAWHGKDDIAEKHLVNGKFEDVCYSPNDDWSMDEAQRFTHDYTLLEAYELPFLGHYDNGKVAAEAGMAAIKQQLLAKRAVTIFAYDGADDGSDVDPDDEVESVFFSDGTLEFFSENWAHYNWGGGNAANHVVTIVGWDDNYPKENFLPDVPPKGNGAWLVKNSWGSGEEDFPNRGDADFGILVPRDDGKGGTEYVNSGYYWLSYYDKCIRSPEAFVFGEAKGEIVHQYDCMPVNKLRALQTKEKIKGSNVFCAENGELLQAVACETSAPGTKVRFDVYILREGYQNPEDGVRVATQVNTFAYGGYHRVSLEKPVSLQKGQAFSVVVTQLDDAKNYRLSYHIGEKKHYEDQTFWRSGVINRGESFVFRNGGWEDLESTAVRSIGNGGIWYIREPEERIAYDNLPIKAFGTPLSRNVRMVAHWEESSDGILELNRIYEDRVSLSFVGPAGVSLGRPRITWTLAAGGEQVAEIVRTDYDSAEIRAKSPGRTYLLVDVEGVGTSTLPIIVEYTCASRIELTGGNRFVYTGWAIRPDVRVFPKYGNLRLANYIHYKLFYEDNVKCGVGTARVERTEWFQNPEEGNVTLRKYFAILPKKAAISKIEVGEAGLAVTMRNDYSTGIDGYLVRVREAGSMVDKWKKRTVSGGKTRAVLKGLQAEKCYEVQACAYINVPEEKREGLTDSTRCYGAWSKLKLSKKVQMGIPKAIVRSVSSGIRSITVTVQNQSYAGITGYQVAYRKKGSSRWTKVVVEVPDFKIKLQDLLAGMKYGVKARCYVKEGKLKPVFGKWSKMKACVPRANAGA